VIDFLSDWMRGLILVIFLAVFLDMILPNNRMQRYAKVVMGLLVILLMMNPVLKMMGANVYEMDFSLDKMLRGGSSEEQSLPTLDTIQEQGRQLQAANDGRTLEQWRAAIGEQVKTLVEREHQEMQVQGVDVKLAVDEAGQAQSLTGFRLTMGPKHGDAVRPISEIEPVVIGGDSPASDVTNHRETVPASFRDRVNAIKSRLAGEYEIPESTISVIWQDGGQGVSPHGH